LNVLGAFVKLQKATFGFVMFVCSSVRPSVRTKHRDVTGRIFMKFDI